MVPKHPVVYSRAPAWHKQNVIAGMRRLIDGNAIQINPYVATGLNADYDAGELAGNSGCAIDRFFEQFQPSRLTVLGGIDFKQIG